jgi:hypothetical protein
MLTSFKSISFQHTNPIVVPDSCVEVILTSGEIIRGISSKNITNNDFYINDRKISFDDVHWVDHIQETLQEFCDRKNCECHTCEFDR